MIQTMQIFPGVTLRCCRDTRFKQGCLSFLLETRGNGTALVNFPRRIVTQVISVSALLDYASENAASMQTLVDAEKQYIIDKGATYRADDQVLLSTTAVADADYGYVGSSPEHITLYRGREVVERNIHQREALDHLIEIIKADGKWHDPK